MVLIFGRENILHVTVSIIARWIIVCDNIHLSRLALGSPDT
jgi:hypothetical protein